MSTDRLIAKVGMLLEASAVKKSMVIPYFLVVVFSQYILFDIYFLLKPSVYINSEVISKLLIFHLFLLVCTTVMIYLRHSLERSATAQKIVPYAFSLFFVFSLTTLGYMVGHMSIVTGMVMAAAPLFATILFERNVIIAIVIAGLLSLSSICALYLYGVLSYAPVFTFIAIPDFQAKLFYLACMIFFATPYIASTLIGSYLLLSYWRLREEDIRRMSLTDSMIGMSNRRSISNHLIHTINQQFNKTPLSIILVDIDFFKKVNDNYGHTIGDIVLCRVGDCLQTSIRNSDQIGRYGGEEFLIVLPNTSLEEAKVIAERCRKNLEREIIWNNDNQRILVTASFGVYCSPQSDDDLFTMLQRVDIQLYRAKENGRNQVCVPEYA